MFFFPIVHVILSGILSAFSILIFSDIDEVEYKPEKLAVVSDRVTTYFYAELILSIIMTFTSFFSSSKYICFISAPMSIYNLYCLYKKNYKLYFSIGEEKSNKENYRTQSFRYKVKFVLYALIAIISLFTLILFAIYYFIENFLNSPQGMASIFEFFGIIEKKK